jgi:hypothetical protein
MNISWQTYRLNICEYGVVSIELANTSCCDLGSVTWDCLSSGAQVVYCAFFIVNIKHTIRLVEYCESCT